MVNLGASMNYITVILSAMAAAAAAVGGVMVSKINEGEMPFRPLFY